MIIKRGKFYKTPVIAGKYKGKAIYIPKSSVTRSSKAVLRESLFNTIGFDIINRAFVEVFAGSGSVAIEAISRGASKAWCIEKDRNIYKILETNVHNITQGEINIIQGDSFELLKGVCRELKSKDEKAFFYFDPPFSMRDGMKNIYQRVFELIEDINRDIVLMIIIEYMSKERMPERIGEFKLQKNRKFGKSSLAYYIPSESG